MNKEVLLNELTFKATRSGGPGGQHVNKTSTKVELYWELEASAALSAEEKERLQTTLAGKLNKEGLLVLSSGQTRSQVKNKQKVIEKFLKLLEKRAHIPKKRKKRAVPKSVKMKRLKDKKNNSEKKASRKKPVY